MTTTPTPPHAAHTPARRTRLVRRVAGVGAALALAATLPVAAGSPASAASRTSAHHTVHHHSSMSIHLSRSTQTRGRAPVTAHVHVHVGGAKTTGHVRIWVSGHRWRLLRLHHGNASTHLSRRITTGRHKVTTRFYPSVAHVEHAYAYRYLHVKAGTPKVVTVAKKYVGTPYRWGGTTPHGFDCSGFTRYVYAKAHVKSLPHSSSAQHHVGHVVSHHRAKPGDLIWTPGHVAIYLGHGKEIDAPRPGERVHVHAIWQTHPSYVRVSSKAVSV